MKIPSIRDLLEIDTRSIPSKLMNEDGLNMPEIFYVPHLDSMLVKEIKVEIKLPEFPPFSVSYHCEQRN